MVENYIQHENLGAAVHGSGALTDHGEPHIDQVEEQAGDIITNIEWLSGYEVFILLLGILFHDIGNIEGRDEHEKKIYEILDKEKNHFQLQSHEMRIVCDIAKAHGGHSDSFGKDTIREVTDEEDIGGIRVRAKALAAILRFADEISDDENRANFGQVDIPEENQIYHEFSKALKPHRVNGDTLPLTFEIPYNCIQKKMKKEKQTKYLYDEILDRLKKCIVELEYCKKYDLGLICVNTISVKIHVLQKDSFRKIPGVTQSFRMSLQGYPATDEKKISCYIQNEESSSSGLLSKWTKIEGKGK